MIVTDADLSQTSRSRYGSDLRDIPNTIETDAAVEYISRYGKSPAPLFAPVEKSSAMQLVVMIEGMDEDSSRQLEGALSKADHQAAFTISDPPSASANTRLMASFNSMDILPPADCDLASMVNPFNTYCWPGESSVVKFDVQKVCTFSLLPHTLTNNGHPVPQDHLHLHRQSPPAAELRLRRRARGDAHPPP